MKAFVIVKNIKDKRTNELKDIEFSLITLKNKKCCVYVQYVFKTKKPYNNTIAMDCSDKKFEHIKDLYTAGDPDIMCELFGEKEIVSKANKMYTELLREHGEETGWWNNQIVI